MRVIECSDVKFLCLQLIAVIFVHNLLSMLIGMSIFIKAALFPNGVSCLPSSICSLIAIYTCITVTVRGNMVPLSIGPKH